LKPTRGLPNSWLSHMPRERRVALGSLAFLVVLLGSLIAYQRFADTTPDAIEPLVAPGVQAPTVPDGVQAPQGQGEVATAQTAAAAPPQQLARPLAGKHKVIRNYGYMYSGLFGDYRIHPGFDYAATAGESVLAAAAGKVSRIDDDPAEGRYVELDHGNGLVTRYAGLGELKVGLNAAVQAGTVIGQISPGEAPYLHFEVSLNGSPVDPAPYLRP